MRNAKNPPSSSGALLDQLLKPAQGVLGLLERPERGAADDRAHRMGAEQERRDDAEVAPATAKRPEEIGVLVGARGDHAPVREHHIGGNQIVDRQPAASREIAAAAAECQPAHPGCRDEAARRRQAEGMCGMVDIAPRGAAFHADGASPWVDANAAKTAEVDDETPVDYAETARVVATPAHRDQHTGRARGVDAGDDIRDVRDLRDRPRPALDHRVVHGAGRVVAGIIPGQELTPEPGAERFDKYFRQCRVSFGSFCHPSSPSCYLATRL